MRDKRTDIPGECNDRPERGSVRHYIGSDDCAVATCTEKQEFPDAECPYCIVHSIENWQRETS